MIARIPDNIELLASPYSTMADFKFSKEKLEIHNWEKNPEKFEIMDCHLQEE